MFPIYVDTTKRASQIAQEQTNSNKLHKYVYSLVDLTDSGILEIFSNISKSQFRPDLHKRDAQRPFITYNNNTRTIRVIRVS